MVVRILVDDGRNQKGRKEFAGDVLGKADAHVASKAGHAGAVGGIGVGTHCDAGVAQNRDDIEGIQHVAHRQPTFLLGRQRFHLRSIGKALIPVLCRRCAWWRSGLSARLGMSVHRRITHAGNCRGASRWTHSRRPAAVGLARSSRRADGVDQELRLRSFRQRRPRALRLPGPCRARAQTKRRQKQRQAAEAHPFLHPAESAPASLPFVIWRTAFQEPGPRLLQLWLHLFSKAKPSCCQSCQ